jgi:hypothetical protein
MTDQTAPVTPRTKPHPCVDCANDPTGRGICAEHLELAERSTAARPMSAPETPRTEEGRAFLATVERAVLDPAIAKMLGGGGKPALVALVSPDAIRDAILAIEREAGSTDALRMDDDHEPHPCCRHPRCCPHALAASDAGPKYGGLIAVAETAQREGYPIHVATRTTCQQHIVAGDHMRQNFAFGQASDAGPAGSTDALRAALDDMVQNFNAALWSQNRSQRRAYNKAVEALATPTAEDGE